MKLNKLIILSVVLFVVSGCTSSRKLATGKEVPSLTLKLSPGPDNPRNSEGAFITLKNGNILFVYSRYTGKNKGDHGSAFLASRISKDGGASWSDKDQVVVEKEGTMNVMSVSLLRLKNGDIALFYLKKNSVSDCIPMMRISRDETQTWSDPVTCIIDKKGYFVLNNDRVIQLSNGRLLMAVALHKTPDDVTWHNKAKLYSYYSDDNGQTWTSSEAVSSPAHIITQEPGVVELKNGNVMMFIRASSGSQYISYSEDKGETWSEARPGNIKSPLSPASIKRIPATGDLLLVWNNNDGSIPAIKDKRTPLHAAISDDDGKSWKLVTVIADDPDGWYCYIAIHFNKDHILLGYCAGSRRDNTHLSVVDITRLTTKSLYKK